MTYAVQTWTDYAKALAFTGNSLLAPMNQTETMGLSPEFWRGFPDFDDAHVAEAISACECYAAAAQEFAARGGDAVQRASVEYTRLFVGPPRPSAAPWETMYCSGSDGTTVGFGQATFEMRRLLREAGLEISNDNNQYADHIGIELLFASMLCTRAADADGDKAVQAKVVQQLSNFLNEHPRAWIDELIDAVCAEKPDGYICNVLTLAQALLASLER